MTSFPGRALLMALAMAATSTAARADDTTAAADTAPAPAAPAAAAPAATPATSPAIYVGIGSGRTTFGYDSEQCRQDTGMSCDLKSTHTGSKLYIGAILTRNVAVEGSVYNLGALEGTAAAGTVALKEEQKAASVALLGLVPFNDNAGGFVRIGYYSASLDATGSGPGGSITLSDTASGFEIGAGLNANFNRNVGMRLEYELLVNAGDSSTDVELASASLRLTF